jgi:hypothetical protein
MGKRKERPIILEIPVEGSLPPMWDKDERKQTFLKWLDDKPCIYGSIGINNEHIFVVNAPEYVIREWIEKYYIPLTDTEMTVDDVIEVFENNGLSELAEENLNETIKTMKEERKKMVDKK